MCAHCVARFRIGYRAIEAAFGQNRDWARTIVPILSPGQNLVCAGILQPLGVRHCLQTRPREIRRMSDREMLRTTLVNLLEEEMGEKYPVPADDQDLRESLGLDSVDVVGLVMRIEREFRVRLSPEELANVKVVGDLLGLLEAKLADRPVVQANGDPVVDPSGTG